MVAAVGCAPDGGCEHDRAARPPDGGGGRVTAVLALALTAALALALGELSTIASVDVPGGSCEAIYDRSPELSDRCALSGLERHGGAMLLLAALAGAMAVMALRGSPTAAGAVLIALGAAVLAIALIGDLPVTNETGAIGDDFDGATAQPGVGFYLHLTAGALALIAGALALLSGYSRR
jgi:hypothetical protein